MNLQEQVAHYKAVRARLGIREYKSVVTIPEPIKDSKPIPFDKRMEIVISCADEFGVTAQEIMSDKKTYAVYRARQKSIWRMKTELKMGYSAIARYIKRDHSSVMTSFKSYEKSLAK